MRCLLSHEYELKAKAPLGRAIRIEELEPPKKSRGRRRGFRASYDAVRPRPPATLRASDNAAISPGDAVLIPQGFKEADPRLVFSLPRTIDAVDIIAFERRRLPEREAYTASTHVARRVNH